MLTFTISIKMHYKRPEFTFLFLTIILVCTSLTLCVEKSEDWDHHTTLDEDGMFNIYWTVEKNEIIIQLEVATSGWIGYGLSQTGGFAGSDIAIGWVAGNKTYLYDYFGNTTVLKTEGNDDIIVQDKQQDLKLLYGSENKTHTTVKFSRKLNTCDEQDLPYTDDTQHVFYTYFPKDPKSSKSVNYRQAVWMIHHIKMIQPRVEEVAMPKDVSYVDFRANNFTIPAKNNTFYYCKIIRGPPLKKKHHIIKISPVIRPQNMQFVHHIIVFKCITDNVTEAEEAVAFGATYCYAQQLPSFFRRCTAYYIIWAMGGGPFIYPKQIGLPFGGKKAEYFRLQIHYDNPNFRSGEVDDSGLRAYYTPNLRPNDAGLLGVGTSTASPVTNVFPPGERAFIAQGHGHSICLAQGMPEKGITVFTVNLHAHLLARAMKLRHFRNNKELPPLAMDMHYGTHYQEPEFFSRNVKVLPGDQLTVECTYDTRGKKVASFNGVSTQEEMCIAFIFHYPPMSISSVGSFPTLELVAGLTGMNLSAADYVTQPALTMANPNYVDYLIDYSDKFGCHFQKAMRYSPQGTFCVATNGTALRVPMAKYPENLKEFRFPDPCKGKVKGQQEDDMESNCWSRYK